MRNRLKNTILKLSLVGICISYLAPLSAAEEFWLIKPTNSKGHGFFSCFNLVLGHLFLYENRFFKNVKGIQVDFGNDGNYYAEEKGPNWWKYYFEPLSLGSKKGAKVIQSSHNSNALAWYTRKTLDRAQASSLLHRYVKIQPHILKKVAQFTDTFFSGKVIGIHYRGTDKFTEAPVVSYEEVVLALLEQIGQLENQLFFIFVATDQQSFLDYMESQFPNQVIATKSTRSKDSSNIHVGSENPYLIGEEALVDAILLSKCDVLLRTSSSLSLWSTYYNENLPVILLNHRFGYPAE